MQTHFRAPRQRSPSVPFQATTEADPGTPEESGPSGSDFEETRKRTNAQRKKRGDEPVTDTEAEDDSLDRELEGSVTESDTSSLRRRKREKKKGKERMITTQSGRNDDDEGEDAEDRAENPGDDVIEFDALIDDDETPSDADWVCVSGPLPQAARDEAQKLGRYIVKQANSLGRKYKKSRREIMLAAGLGVRTSRPDDSLINIYRRWYATHYPNEKRCMYASLSDL